VPERDDEVALGASTMRALGVAIGDEVSAGPRKLRVVGRAVFSGIGLSDAARASLGEGAALTLAGLQRQGLAQTDQLPNVAVVNAQPIEPIRDQLRSRLPVLTVAVVQLPGVLAAWPDLRPFTLWLALVLGGLALGTMVHGLALTRRLRTRELSTLTALGLRPSQIRGSIVWQSVLLTATTAAVGVTAGIVAALAVWRATADHLGVVSPASSPTLAIAGIALAFALVVAAVVATALRLSPLGRSAHRVRQE
jgi:predicted lysophospholipase L1 biosynthesis ABC-type transport system permease subunit